MKRYLSLACVALLAGSMMVMSTGTADARNGRTGALIAGLIIGGVAATILSSQVQAHHGHQYYSYGGHQYRFGQGQVWNQHVSYCYDRYRSYNHQTNLFLAYSGHYRHCRSPWIR